MSIAGIRPDIIGEDLDRLLDGDDLGVVQK